MAVKNIVHHRQIVCYMSRMWMEVCAGDPLASTIPVGEHHSRTGKSCGTDVGDAAQRQGRKHSLPWGKCHPWSLKWAEPGLASCRDPCLPFSVDTFEMAKF